MVEENNYPSKSSEILKIKSLGFLLNNPKEKKNNTYYSNKMSLLYAANYGRLRRDRIRQTTIFFFSVLSPTPDSK